MKAKKERKDEIRGYSQGTFPEGNTRIWNHILLWKCVYVFLKEKNINGYIRILDFLNIGIGIFKISVLLANICISSLKW